MIRCCDTAKPEKVQAICGHTLDLSMLDLSPVLEVSEMALSTCLSQCSLTVSVNTDCKHPRGSLSSLLTLPITVQSALFHVLIFSRTLSASHCGKSSPLTSRVFKHIRKSVAWLIYVNHGVLWGARHTTSAVYLTAKFSPEPQWCHHYDVCHWIDWAAERCHRWVSVIIYHRQKKTAHFWMTFLTTLVCSCSTFYLLWIMPIIP